jgi:hypothetical protein
MSTGGPARRPAKGGRAPVTPYARNPPTARTPQDGPGSPAATHDAPSTLYRAVSATAGFVATPGRLLRRWCVPPRLLRARAVID